MVLGDVDDQNSKEGVLYNNSASNVNEVQNHEESSSEVDNVLIDRDRINNQVSIKDKTLNPTQLPSQGDRIVYWDPVMNC